MMLYDMQVSLKQTQEAHENRTAKSATVHQKQDTFIVNLPNSATCLLSYFQITSCRKRLRFLLEEVFHSSELVSEGDKVLLFNSENNF